MRPSPPSTPPVISQAAPAVGRLQRTVQGFSVYRDRQIFGVLCLSFFSGLPFLLTLGTLQVWLKEVGVSNAALGIFALTTVPYALKFLWAPLMDTLEIPKLTSLLGQRRSWIIVSQALLACALVGLGLTDPSHNPFLTAMMACVVCVCAATQDNGIEAYRVELLAAEKSGAGAAASVMGFRLGMWLSGGGAMYLASSMSWRHVYSVMAGLVAAGILATLAVDEPRACVAHRQTPSCRPGLRVGPAMQALRMHQPLALVVLFIVCFKVGDAVLNTMSMPFLIEMGFSKIEIAHIAKSFGIGAMIVGGAVGGVLLQYYSLRFNVMLSSGLLMLACGLFAWQAHVGHHVGWLVVTMGVENVACGLSATTLVAFISGGCRAPFIATHFAFLSSCGSIARVMLSAGSGWLADQLGWCTFFVAVAVGCLPALVMAWRCAVLFKQKPRV